MAEINRLRFKYRLVCPECLFGFFLNENMYRHAQFKKQNKTKNPKLCYWLFLFVVSNQENQTIGSWHLPGQVWRSNEVCLNHFFPFACHNLMYTERLDLLQHTLLARYWDRQSTKSHRDWLEIHKTHADRYKNQQFKCLISVFVHFWLDEEQKPQRANGSTSEARLKLTHSLLLSYSLPVLGPSCGRCRRESIFYPLPVPVAIFAFFFFLFPSAKKKSKTKHDMLLQ